MCSIVKMNFSILQFCSAATGGGKRERRKSWLVLQLHCNLRTGAKIYIHDENCESILTILRNENLGISH